MAHALAIWTIGHSTRPLDTFIALLKAHRIELVADVRSFPGSRRHPQYGKDALRDSLLRNGMGYHWMPSLGGRRRPAADSPNIAWRNASFRGYADYMQTGAFEAALDELLQLARRYRTALMCAESLWWRCHRGMIADALLARGVDVEHILGDGPDIRHPGTAPARIVDGRLTYAADADLGLASDAT